MTLAVPDAAAARRQTARSGGGGCAAALLHLLTWQRRLAAKRKPKQLLVARRLFSRKQLLPPPPLTPPPQPSDSRKMELAVSMPRNRPPSVVARLMGLDSMPPAQGKKAGKKSHGRDIDLPVGSPRSSPRAARLLHAAAARIFEKGRNSPRSLLSRGNADELSGYDIVPSIESVDEAISSTVELKGISQGGTLADRRIAGCISEISVVSSNAALESELADCSFRLEVSNLLEEPSGDSASGNSLSTRLPKDVASQDDFPVDEEGRRLSHELPFQYDPSTTNADSIRLGNEVCPKRGKELYVSACEVRGKSRRDELLERSGDNIWTGDRACRVCKRRDETRSSKQNSLARPKVLDVSSGRRGLSEEKSALPRRNPSTLPTNQLGAERGSKSWTVAQKRKNNSRKAVGSSMDASSSNAHKSASRVAESTKGKMENAVVRSRVVRNSNTFASSFCSIIPPDTIPGVSRNEDTSLKDFDKDGFNRILRAKITELSPSWMSETATKDALSGRLTASVLQELISDLVNDKPLISEKNGCSTLSASIDSQTGISADQQDDHTTCALAPEFHDYSQEDSLSSTTLTIASNQLSPVSVLGTSLSAETSSIDSPDDNSAKMLFEAENFSKQSSVDSEFLDLASSVNELKANMLSEMDLVDASSNLGRASITDFKFLEGRADSYCDVMSLVECLVLSGESTGSSPQSFLLAILDAVGEISSSSEALLGNTEMEGYQATNFFFDCIIEYLSTQLFPRAPNNLQSNLPPHFARATTLALEICNEIRNWKRKQGSNMDSILKNELHCTPTKWAIGEAELCNIGLEIEEDIVEMLIWEFCC